MHIEGGSDIHPRDLFALIACQPLRDQAGCHVVPAIPDAVLSGALSTYLRLEPGELPLAIVDRSNGSSPAEGCTLTTRRLCWSEKSANRGEGRQPRAIEYGDLPEQIAPNGEADPHRHPLGRGIEPTLRTLPPPAAVALVEVLGMLRHGARSGVDVGAIEARPLDAVRMALAQVARRVDSMQRVFGEFRSFSEQARRATPRVIVSPLVIAACVLVEVAMVASGVSAFNPGSATLIDWGGNFGLAVALDGEPWRLLSAAFLHGGLIHLLVNMLCLRQAGPFVERLYGNVGFGLLYLASAIGGSLASIWSHPMSVGVGASGAVFGVFGGLLAFLLTHRAGISATVLKPIRSGAIGFVLYNTLLGSVFPQIDHAAHLGGLATGFVAGLLLRRPWPSPHPTAGLPRQLAGGVVLAAGLALASLGVTEVIRRDPEVVSYRQEVAYNRLIRALRQSLRSYDAIQNRLDRALDTLRTDDPTSRRTLDDLLAEAEANRTAMAAVKTPDPDLDAMVAAVVGAQSDLVGAIRVLRQALDQPEDADLIDGPEGFVALRDRSRRGAERFLDLSKDYVTKHGLATREAPDDAPGGPPDR